MLALLAASIALSGQVRPWPLSAAESSNYEKTSSYADVITFIRALQEAGAPLELRWTGTSTEGRKMPLAIISWPPVSGPIDAHRSGKPIVYIQANIHAGEVEGKEAAQAFLRRLCAECRGLAKGPMPGTLVDKMVFLINPIYNADGNEKWGPVERNRPEQDGPPIVGVRANGGNFDLNRDCIKAETPEMQGALAEVYTTWDPDIIFDLHTTDGTRHGFELTYAPPENPNTDPGVLSYCRDDLLPWVRHRFKQEFGQELFDYGNAVRSSGAYRWETFGHEGRYVTNYAGLRNRIGILSEATTYIPFKDRVAATDRFVTLCLDRLAHQASKVLALTRGADERMVEWSRTHPDLGVRFEMAARPGLESVPLEKPPGKREKRPDAIVRVEMPVFDRFRATKTAKFPWGYLIPAEAKGTLDLLRRHGVVVEELAAPWTGLADKFQIEKPSQANQPFQGHRLWTLDGRFVAEKATWPAGSFLVKTGQPLGVLIFHMLEPESTDGVAAWGVLGDFQADKPYPLAKVYEPITIPTDRTR